MKITLRILLLVLGLIVFTNAQGIKNTLGGNTVADKFIIENSDSETGLVVTGEGNVGIGTASPSVKLDVAGQVKISGGTPGTGKVLTSDATGLATWETPDTGADNLGNHTATQNVRLNGNWLSGDGGNEGVFVHANGNVGIGIDTPAEKLHIAGNLRLNGGFFDKDGDNGTSGQILSSTGTQTNWIDAPSGGSGDGHSLDAADGAPVDAVFVDNAGNVGIGTTNPLAQLHIYDNTNGILTVKIDNPNAGTFTQSRLAFDNAQNAGISVFGSSYTNNENIMRIFNNRSSPAGKIDFVVNGGMAMTINDDGNIGIGTTNPTHKLHIVGSEANGAVGHFVNTVNYDGYGVYGACDNTDNYGFGGYFEGGEKGVYGRVTPNVSAADRDFSGLYGYVGTATAHSGYGYNRGVVGSAVYGHRNYGLYGYAFGGSGTAENYGVYGFASGTGANYAGYFDGDVTVTRTLSKGGGSFKIDHPLDPTNKNLYHSFVESPDMMNVYNGNVILDGNGEAIVAMADWFEALNRDFRYQLTCIGGWAPLYIAEKISGNRFKIAGGEAGMEVSWQVTGIRQDAFANANRIQVEEDKRLEDRGKYLHPEAFGLPREMSVDYRAEEEAERQKMEERNKLHDERRAQEQSAYQEQKVMSAAIAN